MAGGTGTVAGGVQRRLAVGRPRFDADAYDEARCSDAENEVLETFGRCLQDLPECDPDSPVAFERALEACALAADTSLSSACGDPALGLD